MRFKAMLQRFRIGGAALLSFVVAIGPAWPQNIDMSGQRITLTVGSPPGGAYDLYARLVAQHLGEFIPGHPTIVVSNMAGAGGIIELNWLSNVAPKDGTALGIVPLSAVFEPVFGNKQAQYDPRRLGWLGSLDNYTGTAVVHSNTPFKSARDLMEQEIIVGGAGTGSDITIWPIVMRNLLDARFKLVKGYSGTIGIILAMDRGEVQAMIGADWGGLKSANAQQLRDGRLRVLMQIALSRNPDLPDVPNILEFAKTAEDREVLELFISREEFARPFTAPPGLPEPILAMLRQAFNKLVTSPDFLRDAERARADIHFAGPERVTTLASKVYAFPAPVVARAITELSRASQ
jgi:tripartite-type tricarboxylate transporter receptor subunit TctC